MRTRSGAEKAPNAKGMAESEQPKCQETISRKALAFSDFRVAAMGAGLRRCSDAGQLCAASQHHACDM